MIPGDDTSSGDDHEVDRLLRAAASKADSIDWALSADDVPDRRPCRFVRSTPPSCGRRVTRGSGHRGDLCRSDSTAASVQARVSGHYRERPPSVPSVDVPSEQTCQLG